MNLTDIETSKNIKISFVTYKSYYKTKMCDKIVCEDMLNCYCAHSTDEKRVPICIAYYIGRCKNVECKYQHTSNLPQLPNMLYSLLNAKIEAREVQIEKESIKYRDELEREVQRELERRYKKEFDKEVEMQVEKEIKKKRKRSESKERRLYDNIDMLEKEIDDYKNNAKKLNNTIVFLENEIYRRDNHIKSLNYHINNLTHQINSFQSQEVNTIVDPRLSGLFSLLENLKGINKN
jgi:hypothetical protein